jgi:hypothetical protein
MPAMIPEDPMGNLIAVQVQWHLWYTPEISLCQTAESVPGAERPLQAAGSGSWRHGPRAPPRPGRTGRIASGFSIGSAIAGRVLVLLPQLARIAYQGAHCTPPRWAKQSEIAAQLRPNERNIRLIRQSAVAVLDTDSSHSCHDTPWYTPHPLAVPSC